MYIICKQVINEISDKQINERINQTKKLTGKGKMSSTAHINMTFSFYQTHLKHSILKF